jgi:hypothetical protein
MSRRDRKAAKAERDDDLARFIREVRVCLTDPKARPGNHADLLSKFSTMVAYEMFDRSREMMAKFVGEGDHSMVNVAPLIEAYVKAFDILLIKQFGEKSAEGAEAIFREAFEEACATRKQRRAGMKAMLPADAMPEDVLQ